MDIDAVINLLGRAVGRTLRWLCGITLGKSNNHAALSTQQQATERLKLAASPWVRERDPWFPQGAESLCVPSEAVVALLKDAEGYFKGSE